MEEKVRYFSSISKTVPERRVNKKLKHLEDILSEMRNRDKTAAFTPIFAAINLRNLPTTNDGSISNFQLAASLRAMLQTIHEEFSTSLAIAKNSILEGIKTMMKESSPTACQFLTPHRRVSSVAENSAKEPVSFFTALAASPSARKTLPRSPNPFSWGDSAANRVTTSSTNASILTSTIAASTIPAPSISAPSLRESSSLEFSFPASSASASLASALLAPVLSPAASSLAASSLASSSLAASSS